MKPGIISLIFFAALFLCMPAFGGVPNIINYQGLLTDSLGDPVLNGDYEMVFSIYDDPSGGTLAWTSGVQVIQVVDGIFHYDLGSASAFPHGLFQTDTLSYLSVTVGGVEMLPRTRFTTVAYAFEALQADTSAIALSVEDGVITSANIENGTIQLIDIGGNGAGAGQIIKWNGSAWEISDDLSGGGGGWSDAGNVVRLETASDSVGIGIATPSAKLDVGGTIRADVGYDNVNAIEGYVDSDMSAVYGVNAIGTEGALGSVDAGVLGAASGGLWAGQFYGNTYTSGSMAIGILSPASKFHMHGADPILTIGTTTDFAGIRIRKYSADKWEFAWDESGGYLYLQNFLGGGTVMVIEDATGEVGFGTTTPNARVHGQHALGSYGLLGGAGTGVLGYSPGAGYGVKGDTEDGYAVYGSTSSGGYGVYGVNFAGPYGYLGGTNYAVYGSNPGSVAGYFSGNVMVTNRLGIGTETPGSELSIHALNPTFVMNATDTYSTMRFDLNNNPRYELSYIASSDRLYLYGYGSGLEIISISNNGHVGIGQNSPISLLHVDGDMHITSSTRGLNWPQGQAMPFGTWNGSAYTERMRFAADGKVGINTNNPLDQLHVFGNVRIDGANGAFLRFAEDGVNKWSWLYKNWVGANFQLWDEQGGQLVMAFKPVYGYVGIQQNNPQYPLDVNGSVNISGNLHVSGTTPFPSPNYDTGWLLIGQNQTHVMTHNLGGSTDNYVVDLQMYGSANGVHNLSHGGDNYEFDGATRHSGVYYEDLTPSTISITRKAEDSRSSHVRVRIWVY